MKQGEIWQANLNPVKGSGQAGHRPVVIVSGNLLNKFLGIVIVCSLTTKIKNYKGNVILQPDSRNNLKKASEIVVFHIRSVSKARLERKIGEISHKDIHQIQTTVGDLLRY